MQSQSALQSAVENVFDDLRRVASLIQIWGKGDGQCQFVYKYVRDI